MPDDTPLSEAQLVRIEATIRAAAADILAGFDRERVDPSIALAIIGTVAGKLFDRVDPATRAEFVACLQDSDPDA